jgi:hypothetical protein
MLAAKRAGGVPLITSLFRFGLIAVVKARLILAAIVR